MGFLFQNLRVYQEALTFADKVARLTSGFARQDWYLADQLRRAGMSISLNIAESTGRLTSADQGRFLVMARGSVHECVAILDLCRRRGLLPDSARTELDEHLVAIAKMLAGMLNRDRSADTVREEVEPYTT